MTVLAAEVYTDFTERYTEISNGSKFYNFGFNVRKKYYQNKN